VLDAEIVLVVDGRFDFPALMGRLHPAASRVERLARERPAVCVAFDLLAVGDRDLRGQAFVERRKALEAALRVAPRGVRLTPQTADPALAAAWLERFAGGGVDGVMAKPRDAPYLPGERALLKVKRERTVDCVVAGARVFPDRPAIASLLLGLYGEDELLVHVGVASSFREAARRELLEELRAAVVPLDEHPWAHGYLLGGGLTGRLPGSAGRWDPATMPLDWVPLAPERVAEVAATQVDGLRFRHPARFLRWRPDRDPRSCRVDQLAADPAEPVAALASDV